MGAGTSYLTARGLGFTGRAIQLLAFRLSPDADVQTSLSAPARTKKAIQTNPEFRRRRGSIALPPRHSRFIAGQRLCKPLE